MILDKLENLERYGCLIPHIDKVLDFYQECLEERKEPKQYKIDGDRLMANVDLAPAKLKEDAKLEAHKKYIDIQICIDGEETIGWRDLKSCVAPIGSFDSEKDYVLYEDAIETWLRIPAKHFTIFYPEDAHAPMVGEGEFYKIVFKVAV